MINRDMEGLRLEMFCDYNKFVEKVTKIIYNSEKVGKIDESL